jgi:hypothetical protein
MKMTANACNRRGHRERPADDAASPALRQQSFPLAYQFVDLNGVEREKEQQQDRDTEYGGGNSAVADQRPDHEQDYDRD